MIVQEIGATEDAPDDLVFDYLQSVAFPNQPMGRSILGTPETVCSFKDENLRAYLSRNYRAPDMVVAATGAVEHGAVLAEVERRFGHFNGPAAPVPQPAKFGGGTKLEARDLEQVHIALALEGLPQRDPDLFSLQVFAIVLGGGMSSRLFQEVREKRGLCYTISAFHAPYTDTGMFGIYAGTDAGDVEGTDAGRGRRDRRRRRDHHRGRSRPRQGADQGRPADGAGKLRRPRPPACQPDPDLWPAAADRGNGRPDRQRDRRKCARRGLRR